ncbi:MAG: tRNA (N6-isopentenyl adenosine(37)-C2)-methylthiotransferase MiaB [Armatimonadota bacterium]
MPRHYWIDTSGCQMNERDSETITGICERLGMARCHDPAEADVAILNTCAVREKPQERVYSRLGELRKLRRDNPDLVIVVAGCVAQIAADELRERGADIVVGPRCYDMLEEALAGRGQRGCTLAIGGDRPVAEGLPVRRASELTAFVNVIYGCDNFCAYCIVPFARGREQSRLPKDVLAEVERAVASGARDVTLLGQNVNSYGRDLSGEIDFPELLCRVDAVEGLDRLRFTTSHPKDMTRRLIDAMADLPAVCEHLHLPIQAGSDRVLEAMGRGYSYERFRTLIEAAREAVPDLAVTTDVMVGFPGEARTDFAATLRAFQEIRFDQAFMFKYNDRPRTRAERMEPKVPEEEKQRRLEELVALQNEIARDINRGLVGELYQVLVEGPDPKSEGHVRGRTRQHKLMIFPGGKKLIGRIVPVRAEKAFLWGWMGRQIDAQGCADIKPKTVQESTAP